MRISACLLVCLAISRAWAFYEDSADSADVAVVTSDSFQKEVLGSSAPWIIEFYAPWCGHCKALAPEFLKAAENLRGFVKVGAVNCDEEKDLCGQAGIRGFPTIKTFGYGPKTGGPSSAGQDYNGARKAGAIAVAAMDLIPNFSTQARSLEDLTGAVAGKEKMRVVLFTDKDSTPALYRSLSAEFKQSGVRFVEARAAKKSAEWWDVAVKKFFGDGQKPKFPSVFVVLAPQGDSAASGTEPSIARYEGKITRDPLAKFIRGNLNGGSASEEPAAAKQETEKLGADEVVRITKTEEWDRYCGSTDIKRPPICLVAVLDPANADKSEVDAQVALLSEIAATQNAKKKGMLRVVWFGAAEQPKAVEALDLRSGFPAAVIVAKQGKAYSRFVGAFSMDSLSNWLDAVTTGRKGAVVIPGGSLSIRDVNPEDFLPPPVSPGQDEL